MATKRKKLPIVVLDTNVLVSYLFGGRTITRLIDSLEDDSFIPALSPYLEREFLETSRKPKIAKRVDPKLSAEFMADWVSFAHYVKPAHHVIICRDPDDNAVLECALEANADYIVTGDDDLLTLEVFEEIPIITPMNFVKNILKIS